MDEKDMFGSSAAGKKGGKAAAAKLTPDQRKDRARSGALARWSKAGDHGLPGEIVASEEAATTEAIHAAAHPGRARAAEGDDAEAATVDPAEEAAS